MTASGRGEGLRDRSAKRCDEKLSDEISPQNKPVRSNFECVGPSKLGNALPTARAELRTSAYVIRREANPQIDFDPQIRARELRSRL